MMPKSPPTPSTRPEDTTPRIQSSSGVSSCRGSSSCTGVSCTVQMASHARVKRLIQPPPTFTVPVIARPPQRPSERLG